VAAVPLKKGNIMMRCILSVLLLSIAQLALADTPNDDRYLMPLLPQHEGGQHRLVLPAEVYLHAEQANLADLRIFNAAGESLPYAFSSAPTEAPVKPAQQTLNWFALPDIQTRGEDLHLSVKLQPDGTLTASHDSSPPLPALAKRYLIDASQLKQPAHALEINAAQDNALHHLTIEGSDDLRNWRTLADHAPWLDLHSDAGQLTQKRIEFPAVRNKYYRLSWDDQPVQIRQVVVETTADNAPVPYLHQTLNITGSGPDYAFELSPALAPERLRLILPQADSVASVRIFARRAEHDPWQSVSSATFYRISRDKTEIASPAHALPGMRARYWRVHFDSDNKALPATLQLEIGWRPHQLVFLASGAAPYTLAFGNRHAKSASFPLATLLPGYRAGDELKLPLASTGPLVSRATESDSLMDKWRDMEWKPLLLWAILISGVALLGWMAWRIKKEMTQR
jgi:hypothetical protein